MLTICGPLQSPWQYAWPTVSRELRSGYTDRAGDLLRRFINSAPMSWRKTALRTGWDHFSPFIKLTLRKPLSLNRVTTSSSCSCSRSMKRDDNGLRVFTGRDLNQRSSLSLETKLLPTQSKQRRENNFWGSIQQGLQNVLHCTGNEHCRQAWVKPQAHPYPIRPSTDGLDKIKAHNVHHAEHLNWEGEPRLLRDPSEEERQRPTEEYPVLSGHLGESQAELWRGIRFRTIEWKVDSSFFQRNIRIL